VHVGKVDPSWLKVELGEPEDISGGAAMKIPLTVTIPAGTPPANFSGTEQGKAAEIGLETTSEQAKQVPLRVTFVAGSQSLPAARRNEPAIAIQQLRMLAGSNAYACSFQRMDPKKNMNMISWRRTVCVCVLAALGGLLELGCETKSGSPPTAAIRGSDATP